MWRVYFLGKSHFVFTQHHSRPQEPGQLNEIMGSTLKKFLLNIWASLWTGLRLISGIILRFKLPQKPSFKRCVCVIGGGFGGLYTAIQLDQIADPATDIYLVDSKNEFVFLPLLYELAVGSAAKVEVTPKYEDLLCKTRIKHVKASAFEIDFVKKSCLVSNSHGDEEWIPYSSLVIAVGIQPRMDIIPGAKQHSIPFYTDSDAARLSRRLKALASQKYDRVVNIVVLGAGYGGVEVAAHIAEKLGKKKVNVSIVDRNGRVMGSSVDFNRQSAER